MSPEVSKADARDPNIEFEGEGAPSLAFARPAIYLVCTIVVVALGYALGEDAPWDAFHYHLYAGFSALHDRFDQDFFAAGAQSYFNPYVHVPFYWMVRSGLPGLVISGIFAVVQSTLLWITFELALLVSLPSRRPSRRMIALLAVLLTLANPIFLQDIGSSFVDGTTGVLVLIGWLALARAVRRASASLVVGAGVILGLATALKLTNLLYLLATLPLIAFIAAPIFARVRYAVIFGVGAAFGFLAGGVTWWIQVWRALGNPFFPLFNQYFRSPYFTTSPLLADRFIPDSWWLALWRPFAMCDPTNMIHEELRSPDVRYAALLILALVLFVLKAWRRTKGSHLLAAEMEDDAASPVGRTFIALALSFGIAWTLWLSTSANSRYFLPMSSVAAVLIAGLLQRLARLEARAFAYPLLLIAICQGFGLGMGTQYRWNPAPWVAQWLDVDVPQRLLTERDLYLTIGVQSNAFIAAYVHPRSGFINFAGGYTLPSSGPSGEKVRSLLARYAPFWRVMIDGDQIHPPESGRSPNEKGLNTRLARFNLKVDPTDCERITVKGVRTEPRKRFIVVTGSADADNDDPELTYLLSCRVVSADDARSRLLSGQKTADTILDRVEDACPRLFQPKGLSAEYTGYVWQRDYLNTDLRVWIGQGWVNFVDLNRGEDSIAIGRETDWIRGPLSLDCGRSNGHYFAHVIAR